jgi:hypothetical protein
MTRRHKTMKGGFWDSLNSAWEQTKKASSSAYNSAASAVAPAPAPAPTPMLAPAPTPTSVIGGRRRRRTSKRGGYSANTPINGLASTSAPFSGKTAQPQVWVGGRTRRRRHKHSTSCKHKRHRKH